MARLPFRGSLTLRIVFHTYRYIHIVSIYSATKMGAVYENGDDDERAYGHSTMKFIDLRNDFEAALGYKGATPRVWRGNGA